MPPKTRASSSAAAQPASASQPEPQRPTRTSARQRRHSDASNASDITSSSQAKTPAKRRRPTGKAKLQPQDQPDVIEEEQEVTEEVTPICDGVKESPSKVQAAAEQTILLSQPTTKQVHFNGDLPDEDAMETSAATSITPYIRKMTIKRRRSSSPAATASVKRMKSSRTSLPPTLSSENPTQVIHEHAFAPLRVVLQERIRRLSNLKDVTSARQAQAQLDGAFDSADVDDMFVLDTHNEISVAQLPSAPQTPSRKGDAIKQPATPGAYDRSQWDVERSKFHDAIIALQQEADDATGQLRILHIELESLGFAKKDTKPLLVLQSIRDSFAQAREFLETDLPGSLSEDSTNGNLIATLVANIQEFADRLRIADQELEGKTELVDQLVGQTNGILDQLATKEIEKTELQERVSNLAQTVEKKQQGIDELEDDLEQAAEETRTIQAQHDVETARAEDLLAEKTDLESNVSRLSASLLDYHAEAARLTSKINSIEEGHRNTVTAMNREREQTVRDLERRLDDTIMQYNEVESRAGFRQDMIEVLEARIGEVEVERDNMQEQLDAVKKELGEELERRENAEADLEERNTEVEDLETRVQHLDDKLDQHKEDLEELHQLNQTERAQREAAEHELDSKEKSIEDLNGKLQEQGKQANELRQKMFEVQNKNERTIEELLKSASERDLNFQTDMAAEVSRREGAEILVQERSILVKELEQLLEETECEMRNTLAERDEQVALLNEKVAEKEAQIQNLCETQRNAENEYEHELRLNQTRIDELEEEVLALQETVTAREATKADLEAYVSNATDEHEIQIEERDAKIALLDNELTELKLRQSDLEQDKSRLERRVQEEAEFLLVFQNEKNAEVEELKRTIRDKQEKIQTVENRVRETDCRWQDLLAAREEEITALATTKQDQANAIDLLKLKFGDYVRRSSGFIARLQEQVDAAKMHVDEEGAGLQVEGQELMEELADGKVHAGTSQKGKGKKRKFDSAIGMASPEAMLS